MESSWGVQVIQDANTLRVLIVAKSLIAVVGLNYYDCQAHRSLNDFRINQIVYKCLIKL